MSDSFAARTGSRQTLSYLRGLFEERGIRPRSKLGQNFLIDLNLLELLVRSAELMRTDLALEVGSGTGGLTVRLAELAGAVVSVEVDSAFAELTAEAVAGRDNVTLVHADILKNKNLLNPEVLALLRAWADEASEGPRIIKLVANLPYAVATPVIANFLLTDLPIARMAVTVQWEIAERLLAAPSTKPYGALAVMVQSLAEVTLVRKLPPSVFWPRPEVESAIVVIIPDAAKRKRVGDPAGFRAFLRDLYVHRRKNLRGTLIGLPGGRRSKPDVDRLLAKAGLDGNVRAEALGIEEHLRLFEIVSSP